jgi:hypothetical protein
MEFWTGFIDHFNTRHVTTLNFSAIVNLYTLQITTAHTKSFRSAFTSLLPVTDLNDEDSLNAVIKSFLHRLPYNRTTSKLVSVITSRHGTRRNTVHYCTPSISLGTCLFRGHYPVTAVYTYTRLLRICCLAGNVVSLFVSSSLPSNGSTCYNIIQRTKRNSRSHSMVRFLVKK